MLLFLPGEEKRNISDLFFTPSFYNGRSAGLREGNGYAA
jgi:hypothetical protein